MTANISGNHLAWAQREATTVILSPGVMNTQVDLSVDQK